MSSGNNNSRNKNKKKSDSGSQKPRQKKRSPRTFRRYPLLNKIIAILVLIIFIGLGLTALFTNFFGGPFLDLGEINLVQRNQVSAHDSILEEVRTLSELQTIEYIYKLVFPHDFFISGLSVSQLLDRSKSGGPTVEDVLTEEELRYYDAYFLARDTGLQPLSGPFDFVVVTAVIDLGYRLENIDARDFINLNEDALNGGPSPRALITLPPADILNIRIEDPDSSTYPYPDLFLDQQSWRRISGFVSEQVSELPELADIQNEARSSLATFFSAFLEQGVDIDIEFSDIDIYESE